MNHSRVDVSDVEIHVVERRGQARSVLSRLSRRRRLSRHRRRYAGLWPQHRPDDPTAYTMFHTVGDMVGLLDALALTATIVGHDFGAATAWYA